MQSMTRLAVPRDREGRSVLTEHGLDLSPHEVRGANDPRRSIASGMAGGSGRSGAAADTLEVAAWLALMPLYLVLAVVVTVAYAIAVLVVHARS
jgi:hypothetical protein